jgi:hypothetical protein
MTAATVVCPEWCTVDHGDDLEDQMLGGEATIIHEVWVTTEILFSTDDEPFDIYVGLVLYEAYDDHGGVRSVGPVGVRTCVDDDEVRYATADNAEVIARAILEGVAALRAHEAQS